MLKFSVGIFIKIVKVHLKTVNGVWMPKTIDTVTDTPVCFFNTFFIMYFS